MSVRTFSAHVRTLSGVVRRKYRYKTVQDSTKTPEGAAKFCGNPAAIVACQHVRLWKNLWKGQNGL